MIPSYSLAPVFGISISEQRKIYFNHRNTLISLLSNTLNVGKDEVGLVCDALQMALSRRGSPEGVIVHSDRGSQYCSDDYQKLIKISKLTCSMSGKGNYYDNACAESFFHSLKVELIHGEHFPDRETMKSEVFNYSQPT